MDVLSALFRGLFLDKLRAAYQAGALQFFGKHTRLIDARAFAAYLAPLWNTKWVVYCIFSGAMPAAEVRIIEYLGEVGICLQHLGVLVGRQALARVWPEIISWLKTQS